MTKKVIRTSENDDAFFDALASGKPPGMAAASAGYTHAFVSALRQADAEFAARWKEADNLAVERMEAEADRRAVEGIDKPVFYQGKRSGEIREYSDSLLMFRLKARRPEVYRDRADRPNDSDRPLTIVIKQF